MQKQLDSETGGTPRLHFGKGFSSAQIKAAGTGRLFGNYVYSTEQDSQFDVLLAHTNNTDHLMSVQENSTEFKVRACQLPCNIWKNNRDGDIL